MTAREAALSKARAAGYHQDTKAFTRLIVESRVNRQAMNEAWAAGQTAKAAGARCSCYFCQQEVPCK